MTTIPDLTCLRRSTMFSIAVPSRGLGVTCSVDTHGCMTFSESGLVPRLALFCSFHTATTYLGERVFSHGHEHRRQPMRGKKLRKRKEGPIHRTHRIFHSSSIPGVNERQNNVSQTPSSNGWGNKAKQVTRLTEGAGNTRAGSQVPLLPAWCMLSPTPLSLAGPSSLDLRDSELQLAPPKFLKPTNLRRL